MCAGKIHDYRLLKNEFPKELNLFLTKNVYVDLGYLGIEKEYKSLSLEIPFKKPRKSKKNPFPSLSSEQKKYNKSISQKRVCVENAIAGMKRYHILINKYRGKSKDKFDESIELCAGLWNFKIDFNKNINH